MKLEFGSVILTVYLLSGGPAQAGVIMDSNGPSRPEIQHSVRRDLRIVIAIANPHLPIPETSTSYEEQLRAVKYLPYYLDDSAQEFDDLFIGAIRRLLTDARQHRRLTEHSKSLILLMLTGLKEKSDNTRWKALNDLWKEFNELAAANEVVECGRLAGVEQAKVSSLAG